MFTWDLMAAGVATFIQDLISEEVVWRAHSPPAIDTGQIWHPHPQDYFSVKEMQAKA